MGFVGWIWVSGASVSFKHCSSVGSLFLWGEGSWTQQGEPLAVDLVHSKGCVWKTAGANPGSSGLWDAGGAGSTPLLDAEVAILLPVSFMS